MTSILEMAFQAEKALNALPANAAMAIAKCIALQVITQAEYDEAENTDISVAQREYLQLDSLAKATLEKLDVMETLCCKAEADYEYDTSDENLISMQKLDSDFDVVKIASNFIQEKLSKAKLTLAISKQTPTQVVFAAIELASDKAYAYACVVTKKRPANKEEVAAAVSIYNFIEQKIKEIQQQ